MKINNLPLDQSQTMPGATSFNGDAPLLTTKNTLQQVQLLLDNQVKMLLGELAKVLDRQDVAIQKLPPDIAQAAEKLLQQPLNGAEVVPQGLSAMLKGRNTVVQNLLTFADVLDDTAHFSKQLPQGIPVAWKNVLTKFLDETIKLIPDFDKKLVTLTSQLLDSSKKVSDAPVILQQASKQLVSNTPRPELTIIQQDLLSKKLVTLTGQLLGSSEKVIDAPAILQQAGRELVSSTPRPELTIIQQDLLTKLPILFDKLITNFEQQLTEYSPKNQDKTTLINTLRQICNDLIQDVAEMPQNRQPAFIGVPSVIDDIIELLESRISTVYANTEQDVILTSLRQKCRQMIQSLPPDDRTAFRQLTDNMEESIPEKIRQAAVQHNIPELRQTWVIQRLAAAREWLATPPEVLRQASQTLHEMAASIPRASSDTPSEATSGQNSLNMVIPLYFGEDKKAYPAYIHVYRDKDENSGKTDGTTAETWLRVCISTQNIGIVDMVFHIYGDKQLNIRLNFSDASLAGKFKENIAAIRTKLDKDSPLTLADFNVNPVILE